MMLIMMTLIKNFFGGKWYIDELWYSGGDRVGCVVQYYDNYLPYDQKQQDNNRARVLVQENTCFVHGYLYNF